MANFNVSTLARSYTEGSGVFSFTVTPVSALTGAFTVRWDIILEGANPARTAEFASLTGSFDFTSGTTDGHQFEITINDDTLYGLDRSFVLRLTQIDSNGVETQIGTDHQVVISDDDSDATIPNVFLPTSTGQDTLVLGSGVSYRSAATGGAGDDLLVISRHQTRDVTIDDVGGQNIIKLDDDVALTHVNVLSTFLFGREFIQGIELTLETGAVVTIRGPSESSQYIYQLSDGALIDYSTFVGTITASGFKLDGNGDATTELVTPLVIGGTSTTPATPAVTEFTPPTINDAYAEGSGVFSFTVTPVSALTGAFTVRWDIILEGANPARTAEFASLTGSFDFTSGTTDGHQFEITINDDTLYGLDRSFVLRLTQIDSNGVETQIGTDHQVVISDDDSDATIPNVFLPTSTGQDTLVLGSGVSYRSAATGGAGDDLLVISRHQTRDVTIDDVGGQNIIKLDDDVALTHVNVLSTFLFGREFIQGIELTLETGAVVTIRGPSESSQYIYQLSDGALIDYSTFVGTITASGFKLDGNGDATTELVTPLVIGGGSTAPAVDQPATTSYSVTSASLNEGDNVAATDLATITITDPDTTYAVSDVTVAGDARFAIVAGSIANEFILQTVAGSSFDYEAGDTITLTVTGPNGDQAFTVNLVNVNEAPGTPAFTGTLAITHASLVAAAGAGVEVATITAIDPDNAGSNANADTVTYTLGGTHASLFEIRGNKLIFTGDANDFGAPSDKYSVLVTATDSGGLTSSATVEIGQPGGMFVQTSTGRLASDPVYSDGVGILPEAFDDEFELVDQLPDGTYVLPIGILGDHNDATVKFTTDTKMFAINREQNGDYALFYTGLDDLGFFTPTGDYEANPRPQYTITIKGFDADDNEVITYEYVVNLYNVNDNRPVVAGITPASGATLDDSGSVDIITLAENASLDVATILVTDADGDDISYSLTTSAILPARFDNDLFEIDADTGLLRFKSGQNTFNNSGADNGVFEVHITATVSSNLELPNNGGRNTRDETVTKVLQIRLTTNVDQPATTSYSVTSASLNEGDNVAATDLATITITDPDTTYAVSDVTVAGDARFAIVAGSNANEFILQTVAGSNFDHEAADSIALTVTGPNGDQAFTVNLVDLNDVAPTITSGATGTALIENTEVPTSQAVYTATGTFDVTAIVWSLSGADAALFNIDSGTGAVTFKAATTPDYEAKDTYSFTVVATSGTLTAQQAVTIAVTDVDERSSSLPDTGDLYLRWVTTGEQLTEADGTITIAESARFQQFAIGTDNVRDSDDAYTPANDVLGKNNLVILDSRLPELTTGSLFYTALGGDDVYRIEQGFNSNDVVLNDVSGNNILIFGENVDVTAISTVSLPGQTTVQEAILTIDKDTSNSDTTDTVQLRIINPDAHFRFYNVNDATPALEDLASLIADL